MQNFTKLYGVMFLIIGNTKLINKSLPIDRFPILILLENSKLYQVMPRSFSSTNKK